ncbi:DUF6763 family protein [Marinibactrum halimedae]|uniref:Uncharacterized protein n=1 Tax=Marinibactrum halimedae TaxID=1444977 RepID=A0AA37TC36_9GAMM|nr:DUF6763 family protein [Marinibactrum halimedae]MCD9459209.1 hypothetical protein [Marinibactrum halimedae]GLS27280.1 hypothetical protein GCM10007877_29990 [Marinibactrum halimedae]
MGKLYPIIGEWYCDDTDGTVFEVVALDESNGTVDIQYTGGEIAEWDLETWATLPITAAAAPEDSTSGYEIASEDKWLNDTTHQEVMDWERQMSAIEPDTFPDFDDL